MKTKETLSYIEKLLEEGQYEFKQPKKIDNIIETVENEIWKNDPLTIKVVLMKGTIDNKIVYQNIIKINDKEVYITDISDKKSIIYFYDEVLFFVNDKITCIPLHYILLSLLKDEPYNYISNAIYKIQKEEDIQFLVLNKTELEKIQSHITKYQDKLNECLLKEYVYNKVDMVLYLSTLVSLFTSLSALKYIGSVLIVNLLFDFYNNHCIKKSVKMNEQDIATLTEYQNIYDNTVSYIIEKKFNISNEFEIIKEQKEKTLLQNEFLRLYISYKKGYLNDKLMYHTSLFINDIELWHSDYENEEIPIIVFDNYVYILKNEPIGIPFAYILESIYEDNPVEMINEMLENSKVKQLKR